MKVDETFGEGHCRSMTYRQEHHNLWVIFPPERKSLHL